MIAPQNAGPAAPELTAAKRALLEARLKGLNRPLRIARASRDEAPLSFAQERLWFLYRVQQGGASYNIPVARRLGGPLDAPTLERALGEVVRRHDALRAVFREEEGVPVQSIAPFRGFSLPVEELSGLPPAEREAEVKRRAAEHAGHVFDLAAGPLFRAALLRLGAEEHVLLVCMHHIVGDGWSLGVLFRELWALYDAFLQGRPSPLAELPVQYADYAVWQREQWTGETEAKHLAYWKARLEGAPELLELPADHPRPPVPSHRGASVPVQVPPALLARLRELGRDENATLYMVVLAAFQVLLARYAGSDDVVVGTPVAGRTRPELQELLGFFVNTLVLRTELGGNPTFREAVRRVRETVLGAYEHQEMPFERLVAELRPERTLSHSALFQVMFQLQNADESAPRPGARSARPVQVDTGVAKFDLTLALHAGAAGIGGSLEYSTDLFDRGTARRMAGHLERILEQAAGDPDRRLSALELMTRPERARVVKWNATVARYPADRCIHQLFQEQAAATPDAVAVRFGAEALTYRELDARANRLANHLRRLGVGPEVRVALLLERGVETLVALLGVLKAGGAYVPLDRAYPAERLAYMLEDSAAAVLLTQERLGEPPALPAGIQVVAMDGPWAGFAAESAEAPASGVGPENLAYVIYTSGSTGRPKGVVMHHRGVCNYIHWGIRAYGADQGNGAPVFSSIAVDLTVTNLLPLFAGKTVRMLPEENAVEALAQALREKPGFGLIKITPVHLALLTPLLTPEVARAAARTLVIGADNLVAEPTLFWQEHAPGVRLLNEYGPTETVVGCSAYVLPHGRHRAGAVPVGRPIQNLTFYVLDAYGEPLPVGLPGELYIGGAGVARGYLGRPGLTAEKFVPDPFAGGGARMYRTGDRARWLPDGNLLFLGRKDNQVKIRGFRVELGEVEAALRRLPELTDVLVVVREDRPGDRRLVAYVVGDPVRVDPAALRERLLRSLPEYMVPSAFVTLESLPQTATGKLDPRTLPAPEYRGADPAADEPRSYLEVQLIQIWEELLEVPLIGPTQSFFELGGNSLLALPLFAQIGRRLGCDLPVSTLYTGATVRQMAQAIEAQRAGTAAPPPPVVPLQPHGTLPPLFLLHSADRNVGGYVHLVRHLGPAQPVYGLRDVGEDMGRPLDRVAAEHVAAMRAVQPHGPYYLVGWSFGGFVAQEMAVQLERAGETVAFVGLLDTMSFAFAERWPWNRPVDHVVGLAHDIAARARRPFSLSVESLEGLDADAQVRAAVEALHAQGAALPGLDVEALALQCRTMRDRNRSREAFTPSRAAATLTLFRAATDSAQHRRFFAGLTEEEKWTLGWNGFADAVEVYPVPGVHATLAAEPHVRVLARCMGEALAAARQRASAARAAARAEQERLPALSGAA